MKRAEDKVMNSSDIRIGNLVRLNMDEEKINEKLNELEYSYVCKRIDVENYIRQRSLLLLKLENIRQRERKKTTRNKPNYNIIQYKTI